MIGDPSGKNSSRKKLSKNEILLNYQTYSKQILKVLNPNRTKIYFNSTWFNLFNSYNFLELISLTTISRLMERNDFKIRYDANKPINVSEIIYPILQGYDSIFIQADIEIGGIDQKFNFLLARDLQKKYSQQSQILIMMPILVGLDGKNKMSKSLGNCVNLNDNAVEMFCKIMSISDVLMKDFYIYLFFLSEIDYFILLKNKNNPMFLKYDLAIRIVSLLHDVDSAINAQIYFNNRFSKKILTNDLDIVNYEINTNKIALYDALSMIKFISSKSEFKRMLKYKSLKINGNIIIDKMLFLNTNVSYLIQIGKKKLIKIVLKKI